MDLIALLELDEPANLRLLPTDDRPDLLRLPVVRVHATRLPATDSTAARTLCGLPAHRMQSVPGHLASADAWCPPTWQRRACPVCGTLIAGAPSLPAPPGSAADRPTTAADRPATADRPTTAPAAETPEDAADH
ncbi:hypothetical protein [Kitasatospora sp. LaBMicrA B282]|uniref:hypothetical protein n=1 Tax=Kitasatospora sp. LaBMicrA B282 TaxID=3420949 RepID=UPI003D0E31DB